LSKFDFLSFSEVLEEGFDGLLLLAFLKDLLPPRFCFPCLESLGFSLFKVLKNYKL